MHLIELEESYECYYGYVFYYYYGSCFHTANVHLQYK